MDFDGKQEISRTEWQEFMQEYVPPVSIYVSVHLPSPFVMSSCPPSSMPPRVSSRARITTADADARRSRHDYTVSHFVGWRRDLCSHPGGFFPCCTRICYGVPISLITRQLQIPEPEYGAGGQHVRGQLHNSGKLLPHPAPAGMYRRGALVCACGCGCSRGCGFLFATSASPSVPA